MRCKLCGNPTNKLFDIYHEKCYQQLSSELLVLDAIYNSFKDDTYTWKVAKSKFIEVASTGYVNTFFTNNIVNKSDVNTYDKMVYSYLGVGVSEEKNRCQMKRTGLSYARYPQWQPEIYRICNSALIVLTDKGLYISELCNLYFPYSKIINIGVDKFLNSHSFYFDVKTSSSHRHRYTIWTLDKKQATDVVKQLYQVTELMSGIEYK